MKPVLTMLAAALLLAACGERNVPGDAAPGAAGPTPPPAQPEAQSPAAGGAQATVREAHARLEARSGSQVSGQLVFHDAGRSGVHLSGQVAGLRPNAEHGFHVHEHGDCSAPDAISAGDHFDPHGAPHGKPSSGQHHAGDMPNLRADAQGNAKIDLLVPGVTLSGGPTAIVGRSIVVHRDPDDFQTQPSGNSGPRIGCGVITAGAPGG